MLSPACSDGYTPIHAGYLYLNLLSARLPGQRFHPGRHDLSGVGHTFLEGGKVAHAIGQMQTKVTIPV